VPDISLTGPESLALLRENASRLADLTDGVKHSQLHTAPEVGEWSPNEILAHMRACCDVGGGNIAKVLAEEHATFPGTNPRTWIKRTNYTELPFEEGMRAFTAQRRKLLTTLDALAPAEWERSATVMAYGQPAEKTVRFYASKLAKHERIHVRQIEHALTRAPR
jgi:hypothetical protein